MRSIIFSLALLATGATTNCAKSSCVYKSDTEDKKIASQLTEYEIFAQKYEATFGERPSDQVWNLGKKSCAAHCSVCQGGQCAGT